MSQFGPLIVAILFLYFDFVDCVGLGFVFGFVNNSLYIKRPFIAPVHIHLVKFLERVYCPYWVYTDWCMPALTVYFQIVNRRVLIVIAQTSNSKI